MIRNFAIAATIGLICGGLSYFIYESAQAPPTTGEDWGALTDLLYGIFGAILGSFTFGLLQILLLFRYRPELSAALMALAWIVALTAGAIVQPSAASLARPFLELCAAPTGALLMAIVLRWRSHRERHL